MLEKFLTISTIMVGSVLGYLALDELVYYNGWAMPMIYTASILLVGAGIRSVVKGKNYG